MVINARAFALCLAAASLRAPLAQAADHADGIAAAGEPTTDIGDLYA